MKISILERTKIQVINLSLEFFRPLEHVKALADGKLPWGLYY